MKPFTVCRCQRSAQSMLSKRGKSRTHKQIIAGCVVLLMVNGTERYREFVADLEPKPPRPGKADVMGVAG